MIQRTTNPLNPGYRNYGGRGITVCERWLAFENFLEDMGHPPGRHLTLDRIDNERGYEPGNCEWRTRKQQMNNVRYNHILEYEGQRHTVAEWSDIIGLGYQTLLGRIQSGWPVHEALTQPVSAVRLKNRRPK